LVLAVFNDLAYLMPEPLELPTRQPAGDYRAPDFSDYGFVPTIYP